MKKSEMIREALLAITFGLITYLMTAEMLSSCWTGFGKINLMFVGYCFFHLALSESWVPEPGRLLAAGVAVTVLSLLSVWIMSMSSPLWFRWLIAITGISAGAITIPRGYMQGKLANP